MPTSPLASPVFQVELVIIITVEQMRLVATK
jgi:hypothetical protein